MILIEICDLSFLTQEEKIFWAYFENLISTLFNFVTLKEKTERERERKREKDSMCQEQTSS